MLFLFFQVTLTVQLNEDKGPYTIEWRLNEQPLSTDEAKYTLAAQNVACTLKIKDFVTEDNGEYSCTVISPNSSETRSCNVKVQGESLL